MRRRFPATVFAVGSEPDGRFSLANERTFLAWVRTALALLAGGVALDVLGTGMHPGARLAASVLLILGGAMVALQAWFGWVRTERALRLGAALPPALGSLPLVAIVVAAALLVLGGVLLA